MRIILYALVLIFVISCQPKVTKEKVPEQAAPAKKSAVSGDNTVRLENAFQCVDSNASFFWKVKGTSNTVFLFGTVHVGKKSFYPFTQEVESAFESSKYLVLELDPISAKNPENIKKFNSLGLLPEGKTLKDVVTPEVFKSLDTLLKSMNLNVKMFEKQQPWMVSIMTTMFQIGSLGYNPNMGVELYFLKRKKDPSTILELESLDEQLKLFQEMDGNLFLKHTLIPRDSLKLILDDMIHAWKCGEKEKVKLAIEQHMKINDPELTAINDKLLFHRNRIMATRLSKYLKEGKENYFVAIGAAHLVGEKSVVDFLKQDGFTIE